MPLLPCSQQASAAVRPLRERSVGKLPRSAHLRLGLPPLRTRSWSSGGTLRRLRGSCFVTLLRLFLSNCLWRARGPTTRAMADPVGDSRFVIDVAAGGQPDTVCLLLFSGVTNAVCATHRCRSLTGMQAELVAAAVAGQLQCALLNPAMVAHARPFEAHPTFRYLMSSTSWQLRQRRLSTVALAR